MTSLERRQTASPMARDYPSAAPHIAVLIPCHNEAATITQVVADFRRALPHATILVCDNASGDDTAKQAAAAGAIVTHEPLRGKGNAVRRMFADVDADVYVLVDGDDTYDASVAPDLINRLISGNLDMLNASRVLPEGETYRRGHRFGAAMLTSIVSRLFGNRFEDMLAGYRVFSRRFVKTFPSRSSGFEIETELTVHALEMRTPVEEVATRYTDRPEGSDSKLHTVRDGGRILRTILELLREERPLRFFGLTGLLLAVVATGLAAPVLIEYAESGLVPRLPTAILATGMMIVALLSFATGLVLNTVTRGRQEMKRMWYLSLPSLEQDLATTTTRAVGAIPRPEFRHKSASTLPAASEERARHG